jgi:hypothetical protein
MFKPFFVHRFREPGKLPNRTPRAFTAMVSPHPTDSNKLEVRGTFCSPKDQFCRKTGRKFAADATPLTINKRELPHLLASLAEVCDFKEDSKQSNWYYTLKYIV